MDWARVLVHAHQLLQTLHMLFRREPRELANALRHALCSWLELASFLAYVNQDVLFASHKVAINNY